MTDLTPRMRYWLQRIRSSVMSCDYPIAGHDGKRLWALERRGLIAKSGGQWVAVR